MTSSSFQNYAPSKSQPTSRDGTLPSLPSLMPPTSVQFLIALFFFLILYSSTLTLLIHTAARFYNSLLLCYLGEPRDRHVLDYQPLQGGLAWAAVRHTWEYHLLFTTTHQLTEAES